MPRDDWIDDDVEIARIGIDRAIRTCPACRTVWDKEASADRFWRSEVRCPTCGVESVRDRRCRALWFANPLRRLVPPRGDADE